MKIKSTLLKVVLLLGLIAFSHARIKGGHHRGFKERNESSLSKRDDSSLGPDQTDFSLCKYSMEFSVYYITELTLFHTAFTVPALPSNSSSWQFYQAAVESFSGDVIGFGLNYGYSEVYAQGTPSIPFYSVQIQANDYASDYVGVNPGDIIDGAVYITDDWVLVNVTINNGQGLSYALATSSLLDVLSTPYVEFFTGSTDNCNNYPANGRIDFTNIELRNKTDLVTPDWAYGWTTNPCSFQVTADAVSASFSWDSTNWTGAYDTCAIFYQLVLTDAWLQDGKEQH
eukprot:TRINITY_DN5219_c0_g1_i1.p1 TRINITY_DN5219_c0_g1~~TRINITY_DN5219_c0_g1_i1.p1  ORF type:complete len:285 (-),score=44.43 TRINITY_DN5219_c0_g1_i1:574-1428(-)